jgi:hypothetical protein
MQFDPSTLDEARVHHLMADSIVLRLDAVGRIGTTGYAFTRERTKLARPRV